MGFWDDKKVIVTGGAGFLGSFVVKKLQEKNCMEIIIPRRKDNDLRNVEVIKKLYQTTKPDMVIHLAARVGGIGANQKNPGTFFYDNAIMGINLIEEARKIGVEKFVTIGTVCSYPKFTPVPFKEEDLWNGYPEETNAPYGLAKKMLLVQSQSYRDEFGFNGVFLIPVNMYGPGDNFDYESSHVIPALIRKFVEAKVSSDSSVTLWGTGKPSRGFIYVEDAAEGIVLGSELYNDREPINIATGVEITIKDLAELIKKKIEYNGEIIWDTSRPDGQPRRQLDVSKAEKAFGFRAKTSFDEGLDKTIEWYWQHQSVAV